MKTLKILVAGMAVLIIIGLALLGWGMSRATSKMAAAPQPQTVSALPIPAAVPVAASAGGYFSADISLPLGSHLEQMNTTTDRVILRLTGPDGDKLIVLDPTNGHVTGTVSMTPTVR